MLDISTLTTEYLEKFKVIKTEKQSTLFPFSIADKTKARVDKMCPYHHKPLKKNLAGNFYCNRLVSGRGSKKCGFFMLK